MYKCALKITYILQLHYLWVKLKDLNRLLFFKGKWISVINIFKSDGKG